MQFRQRILALLIVGISVTLLVGLSGRVPQQSSASSTHYHRCCKHNKIIQKKVRINKDLCSYLMGLLRDTSFSAPESAVDAFRHYTIARKGIAPLPADKSLRPDFGSPINDVTGYHYPININPCRKSSSKHAKSLFVAIISAVGYTQKRNVVRRTWLKHFSNHSGTIDLVGFGFIVGRTLNETIQKALVLESSMHGDIIQVDMIDSYANLTSKTIATVNWLHLYCSGVDFAMKVDDDVYVNIYNLAAVLPTLHLSEMSIFGTDIRNNPVERDNEVEKWAVSYEEWPWADQPTFVRGGSILMTGSTFAPLLAAAQVMPFVRSEDIYLSGLCASKARVSLFAHQGMFDVSSPNRPGSSYIRGTISWLTDSTKHMLRWHKSVERYYYSREERYALQLPSQNISEKTVDPGFHFEFKFNEVF